MRSWATGRACLAARAEVYLRDFGLAPELRAALHAGDVVAGELGSLHKEIALISDPMNTAARMLYACREFDRPALASCALLARLDRLPAPIEAKPIALCRCGANPSRSSFARSKSRPPQASWLEPVEIGFARKRSEAAVRRDPFPQIVPFVGV